MPIAVDGDNLLGTWKGRRRRETDKRALAFELERYGRRERRRIVTFFDGARPPGSPFGRDVRFSGPGRSADDAILAWIREQSDPRGWTVVTSDRSLADQCRWLGARTERSDRFRGRLGVREGREKPEPGEDLDYWSEVFGSDP